MRAQAADLRPLARPAGDGWPPRRGGVRAGVRMAVAPVAMGLWLGALTGCAGRAPVGGPPAGAPGTPPAVTHCGWDGGGTCPSLGRGVVAGAKPARVGPDVEVDLSRYFTNDAVTTLQGGVRAGGLRGAAFPARLFPSSGTLTLTVAGDQSVSFFIPPFGPGRRSVLGLGHRVTVSVPPGAYTVLWLLEAGVGGNIGPLDVGLDYASGAPARVPVTFGDWCNGGFALVDQPPEFVGISVPEVLTTAPMLTASATVSGASGPALVASTGELREVRANCGLWAEQVPLPSAAEPLVALTLPASAADADASAFVMAITLQEGAAPTVPVPSS